MYGEWLGGCVGLLNGCGLWWVGWGCGLWPPPATRVGGRRNGGHNVPRRSRAYISAEDAQHPACVREFVGQFVTRDGRV